MVADPARLAFIVIPALLALALTLGVAVSLRRAGATTLAANLAAVCTLLAASAWMALTWLAAAGGVLADWQRTPPPFAVLVVSIVILASALAFSRIGAALATWLPLWMLVAIQGFRLPLELAMHTMYERGLMPVEMSYAGRNFDIVTGIAAIVVAALAWRGIAGRGVVAAWNIIGALLLVNVVTVAILGTPRFQYFGPAHLNTWVTHPPFVWLPAVMVLAALAGHLIVWRALRIRRLPSATAD